MEIQDKLQRFNNFTGMKFEAAPTQEEIILLTPFVTNIVVAAVERLRTLREQKSGLLSNAQRFAANCKEMSEGLEHLRMLTRDLEEETIRLRSILETIEALEFQLSFPDAQELLVPVTWNKSGQIMRLDSQVTN